MGRFMAGRSPSMMWRSVRQIAQQRTATRTSPGPGVGSGISVRARGDCSIGAVSLSSIAFMGYLSCCVFAGTVTHRQLNCKEAVMPEKETLERARRDKAQGKAASTQAGEFIREEMHHIRE